MTVLCGRGTIVCEGYDYRTVPVNTCLFYPSDYFSVFTFTLSVNSSRQRFDLSARQSRRLLRVTLLRQSCVDVALIILCRRCTVYLVWMLLRLSCVDIAHSILCGRCSDYLVWTLLRQSYVDVAHSILCGRCSDYLVWTLFRLSCVDVTQTILCRRCSFYLV